MEVFFLFLVLSVGVGFFANSKGRNPVGWAILAFLISPLLAAIILACLKDLSVDEDIKKVQLDHQNLKDRVVLNEKVADHKFNTIENEVNKLSYQNNNLTANSAKLLENGTKLCPACAEVIKEAAIKCKHCGVMINDIKFKSCQLCDEQILETDTTCKHCNSDIIQ